MINQNLKATSRQEEMAEVDDQLVSLETFFKRQAIIFAF
jgi:hypothetical protein